jgi:two-component system cell cycle sensor histidine kinase/response regulator CckA
MPRMSGRELIERVSEIQPLIKVLFMSGYTNDAIVNHGVLDGNTWFIQKPFALDALARKVRQVLDSKEPAQQFQMAHISK